MSLIKRILLSPYKYLTSQTKQHPEQHSPCSNPVEQIIKSVAKESLIISESVSKTSSQSTHDQPVDHHIPIPPPSISQYSPSNSGSPSSACPSSQQPNHQKPLQALQNDQQQPLDQNLQVILKAERDRADRPILKNKNKSLFKKCLTCGDSLLRDEPTKTLACSHRFHQTCLNKSKRKQECPMCNSSKSFSMNLTLPAAK